MSLEKLIKPRTDKYTPNLRFVKSWWPKPRLRPIQEKYWGNKWSNNNGILHKWECTSFSAIGFCTNKKQKEGLPKLECMGYGETPQQAYNNWCELFKVWNKETDWIG